MSRWHRVWVAPQGEITKYTIARDLCHAVVCGENPGMLYLTSDQSLERRDVPLTIRIQVLTDAVDALVIDGVVMPLERDMSVVSDVVAGDSVEVVGALLSSD